jgi:hypothetical protein
MRPDWRRVIEAIHQSSTQAVVAITGGGATAISDLLAVPGGSRTLLEALVPYSSQSLTEWLRREPEHYCSETTALAMASVACRRALHLATDADGHPIGIGCTASLVSERPKRGPHRVHVAVQTATCTRSYTFVLAKGLRDRAGEERAVADLVLIALAEASRVPDTPDLALLAGERVQCERTATDSRLAAVWGERADRTWSLPGGKFAETPALPFRGLLCGAFNPLHRGHAELRRVAERRLGGAVFCEMSITNVDKPPLDYLTIERRRLQFPDVPLALTHAPTFVEKSRIFPGTVFVVGIDTAERIVQPRYYGGEAEMHQALALIHERGCRFLTAGRVKDGVWHELPELKLPREIADLFEPISENEFRVDISSTELRSHTDET